MDRRLIFPLTFNGNSVDLVAVFDLDQPNSTTLKLSHVAGTTTGGTDTYISYSSTLPTSDGHFISSEHWINGTLMTRFFSNSSIDIDITTRSHITSKHFLEALAVERGQFDRYYEEIVDPITEAVSHLSSRPELLKSLPDDIRLSAAYSWNDPIEAPPNIKYNDVHIRFMQPLS